jgi:hypothetical protein
VSMTLHMKAVDVSPIKKVVNDSPVGVVDVMAAAHNQPASSLSTNQKTKKCRGGLATIYEKLQKNYCSILSINHVLGVPERMVNPDFWLHCHSSQFKDRSDI